VILIYNTAIRFKKFANSLKIDFKIYIFIGVSILWLPGLTLKAQSINQGAEEQILSVSFVKPEISQKAGQLSFNVIRIRNNTDTAIRFKPILILPDNWITFSPPFNDTIVQANDSISLLFRFQLPEKVSSEIKHEIAFRVYSMQNKLLSENSCAVFPEAFHNWNVIPPVNRVFFLPRKSIIQFDVRVENNGNTEELINLNIDLDKKVELTSLGAWQPGQPIALKPFKDTTLRFNARYIKTDNRVFDISKIQFGASTDINNVFKSVMVEKYNDTYSPLIIDRSLPHQTEVGFRTFSGNNKFLPFLKARGLSTFKNASTLQYNFNYYALTGNEDFISNSYYQFLYRRRGFKAGLGAFSSSLGRNLYTRNGLMLSQVLKLSPAFSIEAFVSQSFITQKTSVAAGYTIEKEKISLHGSFAYDLDKERNVNTGSVMLQSNLFTIFKGHDISFNVYGYHEDHDLTYDYTLAGFAWDINYFAKIGDNIAIQVINNYGSPNIPGPQMGLLNFGANGIVLVGNKRNFFSVKYVNSSRKYHTYNFEGEKSGDISLSDQYINLLYHSNANLKHTWEAGPSTEIYHSYRPPYNAGGPGQEYEARKIRLEYKGIISNNLTLNLKTGMTNIYIKETTEIRDTRYDFHLLGGYSIISGYGFSFSYDYGPMVNSGLYQFSGDIKNHSFNIGPSIMKTYFNERLKFNLFANFIYRFDLNYASFNINPKIEAFIFRDWYIILSGTYHFTRQQYPDYLAENSYTYAEVSIKKRWGKSDQNKWQKDTRRLRVVLFKDDNGNGVKDDLEQGVPNVKTRLRLTNSDNPNFSDQFPVDIILLSNSAGSVNYNRLPKGFYELSITPLGDVKEYFYVNRSAEKLELTRNATYYIPFQKANKISGKIAVKRAKFIKAGEEDLSLTNIKITAYNKQGNSYSSFTLQDGSFTIFVPENNTYYVRMGNVFGPTYKILKNDINIAVGDSTNNHVVFNVNEISRQVKFKSAKPAPAPADTLKPEPLKIKILHGKFYENSKEAAVDKDAVPHFEIKEAPVQEQNMIPGNYYVVIGTDTNRTQAVKLYKILEENGLRINLGFDELTGTYYVYSKYFLNRSEAKKDLDLLIKANIDSAEIFKFE